jgi:hypothetical protein
LKEENMGVKENLPTIVDMDVINSYSLANTVVYKTYLENLNKMMVLPCPEDLQKLEINYIARFFKVERFETEKNENDRDKLISVFHAVASCGGSVIVLIHSDGKKINYYFGTITPNVNDIDLLETAEEALEKTLKGNFPGTNIVAVREVETKELVDKVFLNEKFAHEKQICTVTGIAGLRSKDESSEKLFIQGMEKLIDSMRGEKYSLLLIADPVSQKDVNLVKQGYERLYSQIFPFADRELTYGENESESVSNSLTKGFSKAINESVTNSFSYTKGSSKSHTHDESNSFDVGFSFKGISVGFSHSESDSYTSETNESTTKDTANTKGTMETKSKEESITKGKEKGISKSLQLKFENKTIKNLLEKIDLQLKRLDSCRDTGMWNCSVYCLSDVASVSKIAASAYQSILRGENSSIETGTITEWSKENAIAIIQ